MTNTNDHWSRAHELGNATRKLLATANTGGIGILLALAGSLAADGVSPGWAVPAVAAFSLGVIFVVVGYLLAEHRAIAQAKAHEGQYPEFSFWKWGIVWNGASLICLLAGAFLGISGLNAVQVQEPDEPPQDAPASVVDMQGLYLSAAWQGAITVCPGARRLAAKNPNHVTAGGNDHVALGRPSAGARG